MEHVKLLATCHAGRAGSIGNVCVAVLTTSADFAQLDMLEQAIAAMVKTHEKFVSINVVTATKLEAPSKEFRDRSAQVQDNVDPHLHCSAVVITGGGLAGVMVRTFMVVHELAVKRKKPQQVFRDVKASVEWVQKTVPETAKIAGLAQAIEDFVNRSPDAA